MKLTPGRQVGLPFVHHAEGRDGGDLQAELGVRSQPLQQPPLAGRHQHRPRRLRKR